MLGQMIGSGRSDMWFDILKTNTRIAMSNSPKLIDKTYDQNSPTLIGKKPHGLWYSFSMGKPKSSWLRWLFTSMPEWLKNYDYFLEIDVSSASIKKIETKEQVLDFHDRYEEEDYEKERLIDWGKVAKDYDGIEVRNPKALMSFPGGSWLWGWDVDSGCIWNTQSISVVKVKPIEKRHRLTAYTLMD